MSNNENEQLKQLEEGVQDSIRRGVVYDRQFVSYQFEYNSKMRSLDMKEQLIELNNDEARSAPDSERQNVEKEDNFAATVIKRKALEYRERYHSLNTNEKGVVSQFYFGYHYSSVFYLFKEYGTLYIRHRHTRNECLYGVDLY